MKRAKRAAKPVRRRCSWPSSDISLAYHDREWGVPLKNDRKLFEFLVLDAAQAGLSWEIILRKREGFRAAFDNFDPEKIAGYEAKQIAALMDNPGIVRNRAKIEGTVASARAYLEIEAREGFADFVWNFFDGQPQQNGFRTRAQIPTQSPKAMALSKGLKDRGFKFCGPTIVYAFCQATGMVNDHLVSCWRYEACATLAHTPPPTARRRAT